MRVRAKNLWGQTLDPQRVDLWQLNMKAAIQGLLELDAQSPYSPVSLLYSVGSIVAPQTTQAVKESYIRALTENAFFYAKAIQFPQLSVSSQPVLRDSRPYHLPDYDNPLDAITITFYHDIGRTIRNDVRQSEVYRLLDQWRRVVRAGRGSMSTESIYTLRSDFRLPQFRFDLTARFLTGLHYTGLPGTQDGEMQSVTEAIIQDQAQLEDAVEVGASYVLKNAWLSSVQLAGADHDGRGTHMITATLYAEDLLPL